jgi:hypothetical protein
MSTSFSLCIHYSSLRNDSTVCTIYFRCDQIVRICSKLMQNVEKFVTVFGAYVWLTMITVFALTSAFFWCSANYPDRMVEKESKTLYTTQVCMYSAWRSSVPGMPRTWKLRIFFVIYVCYCFAMNIVFKAYFISYFVEPGMRRKL